MSILNSTNSGKVGIPVTYGLLMKRGYVWHTGFVYRWHDNPLEELKYEKDPRGQGYYTAIWVGHPKTRIENLQQLEYLEKYWTAQDGEEMTKWANMIDPKHNYSNVY